MFAWFLLAITMMAGGGNPGFARIMLGVVAALVVASVLCLVAGLLKPQRPIGLKLSLASGAIWIACALVIVLLQVIGASAQASMLDTLKFASLVALPSVFPFATAALIAKQGHEAA